MPKAWKIERRWGVEIVFLVAVAASAGSWQCSMAAAATAASDTADSDATPRVWPAARTESYGNGTLYLGSPELWRFEYAGHAPEVVVDTLDRAQSRFRRALHRKILQQRYGSALGKPPRPARVASDATTVLRIRIVSGDAVLRHGVDESYTLTVVSLEPSRESGITLLQLSALTVYGALHGLQTLLQLVETVDGSCNGSNATDTGLAFRIRGTPLQVQDAPLYPHRGLLVDTGRHFLPLHLLRQNLEAMAAAKLNVLHWHLTDSQSWPYASQAFPELAERGAFCPSCLYTPKDVRHLAREAALRGIRVVSEVDFPGHCQSIGASHPELLTDCGAASGPSEPLDVTEPRALELAAALLDELAALTPGDVVHLGGDEVPLDCWRNSTRVQVWMRRHHLTEESQLVAHFASFMLDHTTRRLRRRPIVWQDLFETPGMELPPETIIDVWKDWMPTGRSDATLLHDVVFSACWYLDHLNLDWAALYGCDPRDFNGTSAQKARILGGHASMWGERVDATNFLARVWPRAAAVAEKLWTGNTFSAQQSAYDRLARFRCHLLEQGVTASPIGPGTCGRSPDPGEDKEPRLRLGLPAPDPAVY